MTLEDETKAVEMVVDRLSEKFPDIPRANIEETVHEEHQALASGRIRDFVPVLVEHKARTRLSR